MSKGISKYEDEVPLDIGVLAGNLKKREVWQCLNCPKDECDGCPIASRKIMIWDERCKNDISK